MIVSCVNCDEKFGKYNDLRKHKKSHLAAEKSFSCQKCDKKFVNYGDLNKHGKLHTEPFSCPYCDQTFADLRDLKRHEGTHARKNHSNADIVTKNSLRIVSLKNTAQNVKRS